MADYLVKGESLTDLADKIRAKTGDSSVLTFPADFEDAIDNMVVPSGNQDITTTDEYDVSAKATARVSAVERLKVIPGNIRKDVTLLGVTGSYEGTDTSDATATSGDILDGKTAYAGGVKITGSIPTKTSADLTVSGDTVTAPAGYYASAASKAVASGSVSIPGDTISIAPSISISTGGIVTAMVADSKTVTPVVLPGYVSSASSAVMPIVGSSSLQLPVQAAQTITPTTSDQTISSGKYLTGTQTIKGDANLVAGNIKKDVSIFGVTGSYEGGGGGGLWEEIDMQGSTLHLWDLFVILDQSINTMGAEVSVTLLNSTYSENGQYTTRYLHFKNVPYNTNVTWTGTGDYIHYAYAKLDTQTCTSNAGTTSTGTTTKISIDTAGTMFLIVSSPET